MTPQQLPPDIGQPIVIATHRRSGTHVFMDLLRRNFPDLQAKKRLGEPVQNVYLTLERLDTSFAKKTGRQQSVFSSEKSIKILSRAKRPLIKVHALPDLPKWSTETLPLCLDMLQKATTFYVHRDGREVLMSLHLYSQYFDENARVPFGEFMRQEVNGQSRVAYWKHHVNAWRAIAGVNLVCFRSIFDHTGPLLDKVASTIRCAPQLHDPLLPPRMKHLWQTRAMRLFWRNPPTTAIPGDGHNKKHVKKWADVMNEGDRAFFHKEAGDLLIELNYEPDDRWVTGG